jgi:stress response protein YsnF
METSTFGPVTDWNEVIKKEARGLNDADLGEVQEVNDNYVLTQRGTISKEKFYLPKSISHVYNGHILLFDITEEDAKAKFIVDTSSSAAAQEEEGEGGEGSKVQTRDAESPIPVIEERLEVSKKESVVEAKVIKKPVKETKTVEVELTHEELIIEKRSVAEEADKTTVTSPSATATTTTTTTTTTPSSSSTSQEITQSKTEINIPLKREYVVVSKKPYVKEEIIIKKKPVTETKTITEQVTSEKVYVRNANGEKVEEEEEEVEKKQ